MKNIIWALFITAGFFASCRRNDRFKYYPNGQIKWTDSLSAEGQFTSTYFRPDGTREKIVPFLSGHINGLLRRYDATGKLKSTEMWENDTINGPILYYYGNGKLKTKKVFRNGISVDTSLFYYSSGRLWGREYHDVNGKIIEFDFYTPAGKRDVSWTQPLVLAASDTIPASQPYVFDLVLANSLSNAVTFAIKSPGNKIDSLPMPAGKHRYIIAHPIPGTNFVRGRVYNKVLNHDTLGTYSFDIQHTFFVRSSRVSR